MSVTKGNCCVGWILEEVDVRCRRSELVNGSERVVVFSSGGSEGVSGEVRFSRRVPQCCGGEKRRRRFREKM